MMNNDQVRGGDGQYQHETSAAAVETTVERTVSSPGDEKRFVWLLTEIAVDVAMGHTLPSDTCPIRAIHTCGTEQLRATAPS